jgi:hypothetical protein
MFRIGKSCGGKQRKKRRSKKKRADRAVCADSFGAFARNRSGGFDPPLRFRAWDSYFGCKGSCLSNSPAMTCAMRRWAAALG